MPRTLGIIFGNRDFFPDHLVAEARDDIFQLCERFGIEPIALKTDQSKLIGVETHAEARRCADLFKSRRDEIDGVLVVLPNFGDEKGVADTLKLANLNVPVLVQAYPDDLDKLAPADRRDAVPPLIERTSKKSTVHPNWWIDDPDPAAAVGVHPGAKSVSQWREAYRRDFAEPIEESSLNQ